MNTDALYADFLRRILAEGQDKTDRTGVGTLSLFGHQMRFDLSQSFPLLTTKRVHWRSVALELLWFLRGESNVRWLQEQGVSIWNEWAGADGELGPVYGVQWRSWPAPDGSAIDQISATLEELRRNPDSRRLLVSAWNVAALPQMALAPCHVLFQLYVAGARLSCQVYQRSADAFLGVPFNIASYALLTLLFAQQADLQPGELIWCGGDCHIYRNHFAQVQKQLQRSAFPAPRLALRRRAPDLFSYRLEDFDLIGYQHHAAIPASVAV